jgi:hypothetical protein
MEWCGAREARIQSRHAGGQRGSSATDTTKPPHAGEAGSYSGAHTSAAGGFFFFLLSPPSAPIPATPLRNLWPHHMQRCGCLAGKKTRRKKKRKKKRKSESARRENMAGEEGSWERSERPAPARARAEWGEGRKVYFHVRAGYTLGTPRLGLASPARQGDGPTGVLWGGSVSRSLLRHSREGRPSPSWRRAGAHQPRFLFFLFDWLVSLIARDRGHRASERAPMDGKLCVFCIYALGGVGYLPLRDIFVVGPCRAQVIPTSTSKISLFGSAGGW